MWGSLAPGSLNRSHNVEYSLTAASKQPTHKQKKKHHIKNYLNAILYIIYIYTYIQTHILLHDLLCM